VCILLCMLRKGSLLLNSYPDVLCYAVLWCLQGEE
jgi:hypothetical protein